MTCTECEGKGEIPCTGGEIEGECLGEGCEFCGGDSVIECPACEGEGST